MLTPRINLLNDYNVIAHENILNALQSHRGERFEGYGTDQETADAVQAVKDLIRNPAAEVHFLVGGTSANLISMSAFLRPHEAIIAAHTAHIATHETGAIEATGHKVLSRESPDGKLRPDDVITAFCHHTDEHMVKPRLVYISQTTEFGGVYTKAELEALRKICDRYNLLLYIDGARLPYALSSQQCDLDLPGIAKLADAFYFGGTKNGLLFGEALIICNAALQEDFRFLIKQRGGLLAKGFLLGIQFKAYLADDLYITLAAKANTMAAELASELEKSGYDFEIPTETNQVFPIMDKAALARLRESVDFEVWHDLNASQSSIRFVTTWETTEHDIQALLQLMTQ